VPKFASGIARPPSNCWRNSRARASAEPGDEALIDKVLVLHKDYLLAIDHMFSAVDVGDTVFATKIDGAEVDPRFDAMESLVIAASDSHHAEAFRRLDELAFVQKSVLAATPLVFAIGIALVVFFSRVLRARRRREEQALKHEATAVSRSEKRFRALVQNASDVVLICTAEGTVTYQSRPRKRTGAMPPVDCCESPCWRPCIPMTNPRSRNSWCSCRRRRSARTAPNCAYATPTTPGATSN
jgi:hypothetical protein